LESYDAMKLYITPDGNCTSVYDEVLDLQPLGERHIRRASHVEPTAAGQWAVDLTPLAGPQLGPFPTRSQALEAEVAWIDEWFKNLHGEIVA